MGGTRWRHLWPANSRLYTLRNGTIASSRMSYFLILVATASLIADPSIPAPLFLLHIRASTTVQSKLEIHYRAIADSWTQATERPSHSGDKHGETSWATRNEDDVSKHSLLDELEKLLVNRVLVIEIGCLPVEPSDLPQFVVDVCTAPRVPHPVRISVHRVRLELTHVCPVALC